MRSSIIPILLFLICTVLSTPLSIEHVKYASSLVRRGEMGAHRPGFDGGGVKIEHPESAHQGKSHTQHLQGHEGHKPQTVATGHKGQISKTVAAGHEGPAGRTARTVAEAIANRGQPIGKGGFGIVYDIRGGFNNQRAVLKIMDMTQNPQAKTKKGKRIYLATVENEVRRLRLVEQFLAWGYNCDRSDGDVFYVVMRNMGKRGADFDAGLTMKQQVEHIKPTVQRYEEKYGITHKDPKPDNLVFQHGPDGKPEAHLIDWGAAQLKPGAELPQLPDAEEIGEKPFSQCTIV